MIEADLFIEETRNALNLGVKLTSKMEDKFPLLLRISSSRESLRPYFSRPIPRGQFFDFCKKGSFQCGDVHKVKPKNFSNLQMANSFFYLHFFYRGATASLGLGRLRLDYIFSPQPWPRNPHKP